MVSEPEEGVDFQLIRGRQFTIPPPAKKMGKRMKKRITMLRALLLQMALADERGDMKRCYELSHKLTAASDGVEGYYYDLVPQQIAGWTEWP